MSKRHAFTLIELLVVIAIIGIVAALVVNMAAGAKVAQRAAQVNADKAKLTLMIDNYQSKLNFYPPDNGLLYTLGPGTYYDAVASTNPLLYELTGATNNSTNTGYGSGTIQVFDTNGPVSQTTYSNLFGRGSVQNAVQDDVPPWDFFRPGPQVKEYTNYLNYTLNGLLVPVSMVGPTGVVLSANYWHYDSSSPNRHNLSSYDLWAEYVSSAKGGSNIIVTNGNWQ
jgi:prepilin-type N-terminal cleavage/methylation domain-containing protein